MATDSDSSISIVEHLKRHSVPYLLAGVCLLALLYVVFRNYQLEQQHEKQTQAMRWRVRTNQLSNDRSQLMFGMTTFGWAVGKSLTQRKNDEVNEYFNKLVKTKGVQEVLLVNPAGNVLLSTNKKNQGIRFSSLYPAYLLQQNDTYFNSKVPYELSTPVVTSADRLGTLVMFFSPTSVIPDSLAFP